MHEIVGLYAFEFAKSGSEFTSFFRKFFDHFEKNEHVISESLSLTALAHISITYVQYGMTNPSDSHIWEKVRAGVIKQLTEDERPL